MSTIKANYLLDAAGTGAPSFTNGMKSDVFRDLSDVERARFASGYFRLASGGIQFNGDTAAANALNDYEEGNWTPVIIGETTAGTGTYTTQVGSYTKIGRFVFLSCTVAWTAHTGTGNMSITGLPFTVGAFSVGNLIYSNLTVPAGAIAGCYSDFSLSKLVMVSTPTGAGSIAALAIDTAATLYIGISYRI